MLPLLVLVCSALHKAKSIKIYCREQDKGMLQAWWQSSPSVSSVDPSVLPV